MSQIMAVGVGCTWFGVQEEKSSVDNLDNFDPARHIDSIERGLLRIPNITDLQINKPRTLAFAVGNKTQAVWPQDYSFFPTYLGLSIAFEIFIPRRIQAELVWLVPEALLETETFRVLITYNHNPIPITFVYYETSRHDPSPSMAVAAIRKYLEQEFRDEYASFCSLGPSPFHADFTVSVAEEDRLQPSMRVDDLSVRDGGYKRYAIFLPEFASSIGLVSEFTRHFGPFFASFYALERFRLNQMFLADPIRSGMSELLAIERQRRLTRGFNRLVKSPEIISDIMASMLAIEIESVERQRFVTERRRADAVADGTPMAVCIDEGQAKYDSPPAAEIRELLRLFEGRHLRLTENIAVLVAGVIGGFLGALLTWALASHG